MIALDPAPPPTAEVNLSSPLPQCASLWGTPNKEHQAGIALGLYELAPLILSLRGLRKDSGAYQGPIYGVYAEFTDGSKSPVFTNCPGLPVNSCAERSLLNWLAANPDFKDKKIKRLYLYQSVGQEELPEKANFPTPCAHCRHELLAAMQRNQLINRHTEIVVTQIHENETQSNKTQVTTVGKLLKPDELLERNSQNLRSSLSDESISTILDFVKSTLHIPQARLDKKDKTPLKGPSTDELEILLKSFLNKAACGDAIIVVKHGGELISIPLAKATINGDDGEKISGTSIAASLIARFQRNNLNAVIITKGYPDGPKLPILTLQRLHDLKTTRYPNNILTVTGSEDGKYSIGSLNPSRLLPGIDGPRHRGRLTVANFRGVLQNAQGQRVRDKRPNNIKFSSQLGINPTLLPKIVSESIANALHYCPDQAKNVMRAVTETGLFGRRKKQIDPAQANMRRTIGARTNASPGTTPPELTVSITITGLDPKNPRKSQTLTFTNPTTSPHPDAPYWDALYKAFSLCYQVLIRGGSIEGLQLTLPPDFRISPVSYKNLIALIELFPKLKTNCNVVCSDGTQTLSSWRFTPPAFVQCFNPYPLSN